LHVKRPTNDFSPLKKWACLDLANGEALAAAVHNHHRQQQRKINIESGLAGFNFRA
jgi:hypothetical protein